MDQECNFVYININNNLVNKIILKKKLFEGYDFRYVSLFLDNFFAACF